MDDDHDQRDLGTVGIAEALGQAVRCQPPRAAIAMMDSVLNLGLLSRDDVTALLRTAPRRCRLLLSLADGSAESGPETFVRLMLRSLGVPFETQVRIPGVGRVDFVVDGWLIIECDSRAHHSGWEQQVVDRARDIAAAALGYVTIRPVAADIFTRGDHVHAQIAQVLAAFPHRPRSHPDHNS